MSFDNRHKKHGGENQDAMWTSYSDLFLGLSVVFLLLYVTASLRQGTDGLQQYLENKNLTQKNEDLKQQLKVYESLKQNYLDQQASSSEQDVYQNLMAKLDLLQEESNEEQKKLREEAQEHQKKEEALNQYQQVVRNIINANLIAKARIKNRDVVITDKESVIGEQSEEITDLSRNLDAKQRELARGERKIADLEDSLKDNLDKLQEAFEENKISKSKFQRQQAELKAEAEQRILDLKSKNDEKAEELANLSKKLGSTQAKLAQAASEKAKLESSLAENAQAQEKFKVRTQAKEQELKTKIAGLKGDFESAQTNLEKTKGELAKAQENLNARKKVAEDIKAKFAAGGVKANVDPGTGDVLLQFDGEYFDTGRAKLKPGMRKVLEKAMPAYAQSLFQDPKIAEKIENVEIVGFASPTFKGKFIDPSKLSAKDRGAVNFNLDLSYNRAKSIFDHMFTNMDFKHKQRLLPLVKVTGRSFLENKDKREVAADDIRTVCDKLDCAKQQTVIIKFKLRD